MTTKTPTSYSPQLQKRELQSDAELRLELDQLFEAVQETMSRISAANLGAEPVTTAGFDIMRRAREQIKAEVHELVLGSAQCRWSTLSWKPSPIGKQRSSVVWIHFPSTSAPQGPVLRTRERKEHRRFVLSILKRFARELPGLGTASGNRAFLFCSSMTWGGECKVCRCSYKKSPSRCKRLVRHEKTMAEIFGDGEGGHLNTNHQTEYVNGGEGHVGSGQGDADCAANERHARIFE
ncbi:hypothetical protein BV898_18411 [Hypsibius exemplaris]|uniref:Uncharacterized protein n=1 Tax=Hypsibius exemplaris TaxID=2072580 RepID=A0A9X6RN40_HYPEX|nr:hypothetical protein BV898_18411 [Hypsibius exemplaris]